MSKIISKGHKTWKDGSVMTYAVTDDGDCVAGWVKGDLGICLQWLQQIEEDSVSGLSGAYLLIRFFLLQGFERGRCALKHLDGGSCVQ